jgi:hypothetical protein
LIGFLIIVSGVLLYNEIFSITIFGLNKFTKKALRRKCMEEMELINKEEGK